MSYVLLRSMKIQKEDGTMELRPPGADCPEAEKWANPGVWVRRGYIKPKDPGVSQVYDRSKLVPAKKATQKDADRGKNPQTTTAVASEISKRPKEPEPPAKEDPITELLALSRNDLNALAEEHGVGDPSRLANKEAVAKAIVEARG